jgi:uncharacterized protein (DUF1499 family)
MANAFHLRHDCLQINQLINLRVQNRNDQQSSSQRRPERFREFVLTPSHSSTGSSHLYLSGLNEQVPLSILPSFKSGLSKGINRLMRLGCTTLVLTLFFATNGVNVAQSVDSGALSIAPCEKTSTGTNNCVSTASVKQVDLFMLPWTWPSDTSVDEIVSRIKGVIAADSTLSLVDSNADRRDTEESYLFRVRAARNVCTDEIELLVHPIDRVITYRSRQVEGPENISDFSANRKRMDDIRQRLAVVTVLGEDSADNGPREDLSGQLRAFWGFQSGTGYEAILLDEDE